MYYWDPPIKEGADKDGNPFFHFTYTVNQVTSDELATRIQKLVYIDMNSRLAFFLQSSASFRSFQIVVDANEQVKQEQRQQKTSNRPLG